MFLDEVTKRYIRGNSLICADEGARTAKEYFSMDMHGNVVQLIGEDGKVKKAYTYDSFGNEENPDEKDTNPFRYCGEYFDKETETVYLRARSYDAELGRFLTRDTYTGEDEDTLSLNLYTYCSNDGVNQVDPSGHWGKVAGKYVHQDITKEAFALAFYSPKTFNIYYSIKKNKRIYKALLKGSILPDKVELGIASANTKILGDKLKPATMYHGKSTFLLNKLEKRVFKKLKYRRFSKKEKAVAIGTVLHSIQDYSAHSYAGDLEKFKNTEDKSKFDISTINYHFDWMAKSKADRKRIHRQFKDNPNMNFVINNKAGYWVLVDSRHKNQRYIKAINDSIAFMKKVVQYIK